VNRDDWKRPVQALCEHYFARETTAWPDANVGLPAQPHSRRELYRLALRLQHEGLRLFDLAA